MAPPYNHGTVNVGTSATLVGTFGPVVIAAVVQNRGPEPVYLGGSTVTADNASTGGLVVAPGESIQVPQIGGSFGRDLYAITSVGASDVSFLAVA